MLVSLEGEEAVGKTTFAYTAPLPIVGFQFDMGIERALYGAKHDDLFRGLDIEVIQYDANVLEPKPLKADITVFELPAPIQLGQTQLVGFKGLWNYFLIRVGLALTNHKTRSVVIDTMSGARRIRADSHLEELQNQPRKPNEGIRIQLIQVEWSKPNGDIRNLWTTGAGVRKNLIGTHHLTDERKDGIDKDGRIVQGMLTGKRTQDGLSNTKDFVDIALRLEKQDRAIRGRFEKCGYNLALEGTGLDNPTWDLLVEQIEAFTGDRLGLERRNIGARV